MTKRTHEYYIGYADALSDVKNFYLDDKNDGEVIGYIVMELDRMKRDHAEGKENYELDLEENSLTN